MQASRAEPTAAFDTQRLHMRLMAAVTSGPLRFAPFIARLSKLFDLDEPDVERLLARMDEPRRWHAMGLPGVHVFDVAAGPKLAGKRAYILRLRPGVRFPRHSHRGRELTLVLQGAHADDDGRVYSAGALRDLDASTTHGFRIVGSETCIAALVYEGLVFESWPLRLLARLLSY
jgi:putative transcriptional regulator